MLWNLIQLVVFVVIIIGGWKVFEKAGQPGWAILIPIYNLYVLTLIVGRPWWWLLLVLIPLVGFFVAIILCVDLAKSFGKDPLYGVGLFFLGFIFLPLLGFGDDTYRGPSVAAA